MSAELTATVILLALNVIGALGGILLFRKFYAQERQKLMDQVMEIVTSQMQAAMDLIGEAFEGILSQPIVKGAMTTLGKKGGEARAEGILVDQMAVDMLDSPQFAGYIMGAEALGLDISGYIEKHGAVKTIAAAQQLASMAGIDLMNIDLSSLSKPGGGSPGSSSNPFFRS